MSSKLHGLVWEGCAFAGMILSRVAVMARLADYSNDEGVSWPAVETIQRQIGAKSKNTVSAAINELEREGWLIKKMRKVDGRNLSNVYTLNVEKLEIAAASAKSFYKSKKRPSKTTPPIVEGSIVDRSIIEGSTIEGSTIEGSNFEGSTIEENPKVNPPMVGGDPLLNSTPDPSDKKTIGQPPSATDREVALTDQAKQVLKHLNLTTGSKYQPATGTLQNIRARLSEGFTVDELALVVDYTSTKWLSDLKMTEYLRPATLFQPSKFPGYLTAAGKWHTAGRPACINGQWVKPVSSSHWNTPEAWENTL